MAASGGTAASPLRTEAARLGPPSHHRGRGRARRLGAHIRRGHHNHHTVTHLGGGGHAAVHHPHAGQLQVLLGPPEAGARAGRNDHRPHRSSVIHRCQGRPGSTGNGAPCIHTGVRFCIDVKVNPVLPAEVRSSIDVKRSGTRWPEPRHRRRPLGDGSGGRDHGRNHDWHPRRTRSPPRPPPGRPHQRPG